MKKLLAFEGEEHATCPDCDTEIVPPMKDARTGPESLPLCHGCPSYFVLAGQLVSDIGFTIESDGRLGADRGSDRRLMA